MKQFQYFAIGLLLIGSLVMCSVSKADDVPPIDSPHWMHGKKAIMDVYTVNTETLEIIATNEYAFEDAKSCVNAMGKATAIANAAVPKGAVAIVKCFAGAKSAEGGAKPDVKPGTTEL
jgi:hypothetical protein